MYKKPSHRKRTKVKEGTINLVPLMDALFNLIFFVLFVSSFISIYQISSDLPILSDKPLDNDKKPLALTLSIDTNKVVVKTGVPGKVVQTFNKEGDSYPWDNIHTFLVDMKKKFPTEDSAVVEPESDVSYLEIVKLMDAIRVLKPSDEAFYSKDKTGVMVKAELLFSNVLFGNITG